MEATNNQPGERGRTPRPARPARSPRPQFQKGPRRYRQMSSRPAHPRRGKQHIEHKSDTTGKKVQKIHPPAENTIRIIPLGGVEEIGRSMTAIETHDDVVILDCGCQFREDDTPGIDYILPNTGYLEERRDKIRGLLISHGHLDHIGGIPYIIDRIGNPTIYTRKLTGKMIQKRQEEFV